MLCCTTEWHPFHGRTELWICHAKSGAEDKPSLVDDEQINTNFPAIRSIIAVSFCVGIFTHAGTMTQEVTNAQ
jgi:hypothetical protein